MAKHFEYRQAAYTFLVIADYMDGMIEIKQITDGEPNCVVIGPTQVDGLIDALEKARDVASGEDEEGA